MAMQFLGISVNDIIGKTEHLKNGKYLIQPLWSPDFRSMPLCRAIREAKVILDQEYILKRNGEELFSCSRRSIKDSNDDVVSHFCMERCNHAQKVENL